MSRHRLPRLAVSGLIMGCLAPAGLTDEATIRTAFPETDIQSVDCDLAAPLCEVVAGKSVFYTTPDARIMVIGRVFDLQLGRSLTDDRLDVLDAVDKDGRTGPARAVSQRLPGALEETFRPEDAIVTGSGGTQIAVIADPACPYCARLHATLSAMPDVTVSTFLVGTIGGPQGPASIYCATDPAQALEAAYGPGRRTNGASGTCERASAIGRNEAAARRLGLTGTPVLIRSDGAVQFGALSEHQIRTWLQGSGS